MRFKGVGAFGGCWGGDRSSDRPIETETMSLPILSAALVALLQVPPPADVSGISKDLDQEYRSIGEAEARALKALAERLTRARQADRAAEVREAIGPPSPLQGPWRFVPLPEHVPARKAGLANVPAAPPEAQKVRDEAAAKLLKLARRAASRGVDRLGLADRCLRGVLERQPEQAEARRLLGFVPYQGGWALPHAADLLEKGMVNDATFGWVPADWVPHLKQGELPGVEFRNGRPLQWLPAQQADALRSLERPWQISTAHFEIKTDAPLAEAIDFGRRLEALNDLFFALMADAIDRAHLPLAQRFDNPKSKPTVPTRSERHEVWYFARHEEYVDVLSRIVGPHVDKELGRYLPPRREGRKTIGGRSYFYSDPGGLLAAHATLFHEASHQLLFESNGRSRFERNIGNYWVWEGLGTYFETVEEQADGSLSVGGLVGPRIKEAQARIVGRGEYVPIADLVRMGQRAFEEEPAIYLHYAESMALVVFLMDGEAGKYRDDFLGYVRDAYQGKVKPKSLEERLGVDSKTLDKQFQAFLKG